MSAILRVGDTVLHRSGFGLHEPRPAKVLHIEHCQDDPKYGFDVPEIAWALRNQIVVDLDNGHWAFGIQIEPIEREASA